MSYGNLVSADVFLSITEWPRKKILEFMLGLAAYNRRDSTNIPLIKMSDIPSRMPTKNYMREFGCLFSGGGFIRSKCQNTRKNFLSSNSIIQHLDYANFIIAGEAICRFAKGSYISEEEKIDMYQIGNNETFDLDAYDNLLSTIDNNVAHASKKFKCARRTVNYTDVYIHAGPPLFIRIHHMTHQIAKDVLNTIDMMPCRCFYDGKETYFSLDGALALFFGINPIDWTRYSNEYAKQLRHSYLGVSLFPGLSFSLVNYMVAKEKKYELPFATLEVVSQDDDSKKVTFTLKSCFKLITFKTHNSPAAVKSNNMRRNFECLKKGQSDEIATCTKKINKIRSVNLRSVDVKFFLDRLTKPGELDKYFGSNAYRVMLEKAKTLTEEIPMDEEKAKIFLELNTQLREMFASTEKRYIKQLKPSFKQLKEFKTRVPAVYSLETKFYISPDGYDDMESFWGEQFMAHNSVLNVDAKIQLMLIRKHRERHFFKKCPKGVFHLIFYWLDVAYVNMVTDGKVQDTWTSPTSKELENSTHYRFPWSNSKAEADGEDKRRFTPSKEDRITMIVDNGNDQLRMPNRNNVLRNLGRLRLKKSGH